MLPLSSPERSWSPSPCSDYSRYLIIHLDPPRSQQKAAVPPLTWVPPHRAQPRQGVKQNEKAPLEDVAAGTSLTHRRQICAGDHSACSLWLFASIALPLVDPAVGSSGTVPRFHQSCFHGFTTYRLRGKGVTSESCKWVAAFSLAVKLSKLEL